MTTIIAAIVVGVLLLWGGIVGLLKMVDMYERKHILGLGGYTTLVAGLVIGLVLFNAQVRQQEHARELTMQMDAVTKRLGELSDRLVGQLAEKADLTVSEFEIRARLQNEQAHHERTRAELADANDEQRETQRALQSGRKARIDYQNSQNSTLEKRFEAEQERYQGIRDFLDMHQRTALGMRKQLASIQDDLGKLSTRTATLETNQNNLIGKASTTRELQDLNAQKIDALARSQAALYDDLNRTMSQIDSLYTWKKK